MYYIVVTPFFPSPDSYVGGYVYDQVRAIKKLTGHEIIVYKPANQEIAGYEFEGFSVRHFKAKNTPSYFFNGIFNRYNGKSFVKKFISDGINPEKIFAVHSHVSNFGACGIALKKLNPNILTILQHHDLDPFTVLNGRFAGNYINLFIRASINRRLFENIDLHVSISSQTQKHLFDFPFATDESSYLPYHNIEKKARKLGLKKANIKKAIVLNNGVDTEKFKHIDDYPKDESKFIIGIIGNYINLKKHDILLEAVKILIDRGHLNLILKTVGNSPNAGFIGFKDKVKNLGLEKHVEYVPSMKHHELCAFYNSLDLFVLPSVFEGFGCVFLESYACGVPFISVTGQGISDMLSEEQKSDWLAYPNDAIDLANKIENYLNNKKIQKLQKEHNIDNTVREFLNFLHI